MINKEKNFISAVVYVHNAEKYIEDFIKKLLGVLENNFEHLEIVCVNDCSVDNSVEAIKRASAMATTASVSIVNMSHYHGRELSMNAGVELTIGDFVYEFDNAFMDYDENLIMDVYHKVMEGYDIVNAIPKKKEKLSSRLFYKVFDRFTDESYKMHTESFRLLSRRVINRIYSMTKTIPYRKAIYASQGLSTEAIEYDVLPVDGSINDRQEKNYRTGLAIDSLLLFTEVGYKFGLVMTVIMMLMSIFMVIYSIVVYLIAVPVEGWTTTIMFFSMAFFGLFMILTIIIKYLQLLVDLVFKRTQYTYSSIEKVTK